MSDAVVNTRIHGKPVQVFPGRTIGDIDLECAIGSKVFRDWISTLDPMIPVEEISVQGIYYRAKEPSPDKVLFIMMVVSIPGSYPTSIVLRGPTVVILPVFVYNGEEWTVIVKQRRPATGQRFFPEILAGMTDGGDIVAKALIELEQETRGRDGTPGVKIRQSDLIQLGEPLEPSPGLLSEPMHFFYTRIPVSREVLDGFENRMTGAEEEGEEIILKVIPLDHLPLIANKDMKAEIVYHRYRRAHPTRKWRWWF